ncbi:hypothetical protein MHEL_55940 [Mycolicibacterium helvum]|uniref:Uncharacterized protein n=1 Tax=Mycolicibacterium helvum TaxID=1534349 RepID=A0A7I7TFM1_9MYCO|nr:hypothetical protein MHEL_55940 [Mycolicibacterium helvum]
MLNVGRTEIRVRKAPAEVFAEDRERLVVYPQATGGEQLSFGPEFDEFASVPDSRWYVLWTLSPDAIQVPDVFLAAVAGIDDPARTIVWASTSLPRLAQESGDDDFDDFRKPDECSGSPDPA